MAYPIENWFRPPYEFLPAATSVACAMTALAAPTFFALPPTLAIMSAGMLGIHAGWRIRQGIKVVRFHSNLKRLPRYAVSADEIPWSKEKLFLGMGFRWTQQHTQRLVDSRKSENLRYCKPGKLYRKARALEIRAEGTKWEQRLKKITRHEAWWNPVAPLPRWVATR